MNDNGNQRAFRHELKRHGTTLVNETQDQSFRGIITEGNILKITPSDSAEVTLGDVLRSSGKYFLVTAAPCHHYGYYRAELTPLHNWGKVFRFTSDKSGPIHTGVPVLVKQYPTQFIIPSRFSVVQGDILEIIDTRYLVQATYKEPEQGFLLLVVAPQKHP